MMAPRAASNEDDASTTHSGTHYIRPNSDRVYEERSHILVSRRRELLDRVRIATLDFKARIALMGVGLDLSRRIRD